MVLGMSGRTGEGRRGTPTKKDKTSTTSDSSLQQITPSQKHKPPSAEQVHIARMLGDTTPRDVGDLVRKVLTVVTRGEEDIIIALHDNDYNVEKTIEALLDSSESAKDKWTTIKGRKKQLEGETDHSQSSKGRKSVDSKGGSRRLGPEQNEGKSPRESRDNRSGRSYNNGGGRERRRESDGRREKGRISEGRNEGRNETRRYNGRSNERGRGPPLGQKREGKTSHFQAPPPKPEPEQTKDQDCGTSTDTPPISFLTESSWSEDWVIINPPSTGIAVTTQQSPIFPEALLTTSYPETIQETVASYTDEKRSLSVAAPLPDDSIPRIVKSRRYKSSQIPLQPVEMPSYMVDSLQLKLESLGIDFMGTETMPTDSIAPPTSSPLLSQDMVSSQVTMVTQPLPTTATTHFTSSLSEDTAVIAISTSLSTSFSETPPTKLEPPPGLTHPSQQQQQHVSNVATATSGLLSSSLPSQTSTSLGELLTSTNVTTPYPPLSVSTLDTPTANLSLTSSVPPQPEPLFSSQPATSVAMVTNPTPSSHHVPQSTSAAAAKASHGSGGGSKVHSSTFPMATPAANMVYPHHMLPQFPPHYGTTPMMMPPYFNDVETLNRYQQGFFNQHQTSTDATLATPTVPNVVREHSGNTFTTDTKYDMTSPVATNPSSHQQQQGALQNHPFYPYNYIMYQPHLGMAGYSAQLNHKPPGSAATYPIGTSYQPSAQPQYNAALTYDEEYTKMYPGSIQKTNPASATSAAADFGAYAKHHQQAFDTKGSGYGSYMPAPPTMGGYLVGPPMGSALITAPHEGSSRKHQKYNPSSGWNAAAHN